jgi:hypothetical protein
MFRLPNSHHQTSYIHLKCYILVCVHIVVPHIVKIQLTLSVPIYIPSVIRVTLVASKVFTHNCATG